MKIDVSTILNAKTLTTRAEVEAFVRNAFTPNFYSEKKTRTPDDLRNVNELHEDMHN
ncbi:MAG: hypothetical protein LBG05_06990 [Treponema sp.]|nr:hypothetical protein [Treponema sp.]